MGPTTPPKAAAVKSTRTNSSPRRIDGRRMDKQSVLYASSKFIRMASTAIHVLTVKEYVQCAENKCLTPRCTSRVMFDVCSTIVRFDLYLQLVMSHDTSYVLDDTNVWIHLMLTGMQYYLIL